MSPKLALTIGAAAALVFGLALALAPEQLLGVMGLGTPGEAVILSRDIGVTLLGLALINWMARGSTGAAVRAIIVGNFFVQAAEFAVNGWEVATAVLPAQAIGGLVFHAALGVVFLLALRRA